MNANFPLIRLVGPDMIGTAMSHHPQPAPDLGCAIWMVEDNLGIARTMWRHLKQHLAWLHDDYPLTLLTGPHQIEEALSRCTPKALLVGTDHPRQAMLDVHRGIRLLAPELEAVPTMCMGAPEDPRDDAMWMMWPDPEDPALANWVRDVLFGGPIR